MPNKERFGKGPEGFTPNLNQQVTLSTSSSSSSSALLAAPNEKPSLRHHNHDSSTSHSSSHFRKLRSPPSSSNGIGHTSRRRRRSHSSSSGGSGDNREMVGGCCVCSDERGWDENPLVYCDGQGCNVAVHQACYGIVAVPTGPWFCRKCESQERAARVRCELCPGREGALKRTDSNSWAHVVCALYIPEVRFGNVSTMEPIVLGLVPQDRYLKVCYLCETQGRESRAASGACMQCNRTGCKQSFHVTCAQSAGFLCEEAGNYMDNVKYCGYCEYHYQRINKKVVKTIPAFKPIRVSHRESSASPDTSPEKPHNRHGEQSHPPSALASATPTNASSSSTSAPNISKPSSSNISSSSTSAAAGAAASTLSTPTASVSKESTSSSSSSSLNKKSKKGRRSTSEVKLEAARFNPGNHHYSSSNNSSPRSGGENSHSSTNNEDSSSMSKGKTESKAKSDEDKKKIGVTENGNSAPAENKSVNDNSNDGMVKPPVVLKFGKDNGTYYNKEVSPSPPISSSSSPFKELKKKERKKIEASEADTTSNESNAANNPAASKSFSKENAAEASKTNPGNFEQVSAGVKVEAMDVDEALPRTKSPVVNNKNSNGNNVKTSEAELALSAIKTSCSVTLDKSKIDLKFLRKGDSNSFSVSAVKDQQSSVTSVSSSPQPPRPPSSNDKSSSSVQLTALPTTKTEMTTPEAAEGHEKLESVTISKEKIEPDTSFKSGGGVTITAQVASSNNEKNSSEEATSQVIVNKVPGLPESMETNVKLASAVTIEQVSPTKDDFVISPSMGKVPRISASGKRIGRPPKKGTHTSTSSMSGMGSPPLTEGGEIRRKRKSPAKRPVNGDGAAAWMMGASLNPSSSMAKEMNMALDDEMRTHSAYDFNNEKQYLGVPFLAKRRRSPSSQSGLDILNSSGKSQPQTLEELLERQWEQGSQFLMEQASHFDIASLLSSLHQLKEENVDLEDSVDRLVQRRDHLLAVRARLLALSSLSVQTSPEKPAPPPQQNGPPLGRGAGSTSSASAGPSPHHMPRSQLAPPPISPSARNSSSAAISPVSIQRSANPMLASPRAERSIHLQGQTSMGAPPHHSGGRGPMPPHPRDREHQQQHQQRMPPVENGIDYHHQGHPQGGQHQQHMMPNHRREIANEQRGGMPAHLLAVASSSSSHPHSAGPPVSSRHPLQQGRQSTSSYPPPPPGQSSNHLPPLPPGHQMMRGPAPPGMAPGPPPPPPPGAPGHHYSSGSGYSMVSPPPPPPPSSHGSMVTLDRSSQQHLRGHNPSVSSPHQTHQPPMRMERR